MGLFDKGFFRDHCCLACKLMWARKGVVPIPSLLGIFAGLLGVGLKVLEHWLGWTWLKNFQGEYAAFQTFQSVVALVLVFRTNQVYNRYWDGCGLFQQMQGAFFDSASSMLAFAKMSGNPGDLPEFREMLVSLFSSLSAFALLDLAGGGEEVSEIRLQELAVIGAEEFSPESIEALNATNYKTYLVFHWIQSLIVDYIASGTLKCPPPIISRAFNELADGMVRYEDCMKIATLSFPVPYTHLALWLMLFHFFMTPLQLSALDVEPIIVWLYTAAYVTIFWSLYAVSQQLENPFGLDTLAMDVAKTQEHMNERFVMLLSQAALQKPSFRDERRFSARQEPKPLASMICKAHVEVREASHSSSDSRAMVMSGNSDSESDAGTEPQQKLL